MKPKNSSPVASTFHLLLGPDSDDKKSSITLLDYSDPATFFALWIDALKSGKVTIDDQQIELKGSTKQFLIIGNEPPEVIFDTKIPALTGINVRSHFTATSWLAAWTIKFSPNVQRDKEGTGKNLPRIAVIDPRKASMSAGAAKALQLIFAGYNADGESLVPGATVLNAPSLQTICNWLNPSDADKKRTTPDHLLDLLKSTIWNELTSKSEQHHALSNILAPVILSGRPQADTAGISHQILLRRLLSACGLFSWEDIDKNVPQKDNVHRKNKHQKENGQDLSILLLDDQAEQGWEDWVSECLPEATTIKAQVDPTFLVDAIGKAIDLEGDNPEIDTRFQLNLPELKNANNPVLLLDLRLFSGDHQREVAFYKEELLPLVYHYSDQDVLAWPGFDSSDPAFKRTLKAVETGRLEVDSDEHHEALTWLPRIVAMADMSLPIILFSSTGRRGLVEPFKPYGNIITSFEKPRVNDLATIEGNEKSNRVRADTLILFHEAVRQARQWLSGRQAIVKVAQTKLEGLVKARKSFEGKRHLEIYHDESGQSESNFFNVFSLLAGFESKHDATAYNNLFPIRFYGPDCEDKKASEDPDRNISQQIELKRWNDKIYPALNQCDARICPELIFSLAARDKETTKEEDPLSLFASEGLDNVNWDLLKLLWESLLCDVIPSLLNNPLNDIEKDYKSSEDLSIKIYGATRMRPVLLEATSAKKALIEGNQLLTKLREKWGINPLKENCYIKDVESNTYISKIEGSKLVKNDFYSGNDRSRYRFFWRSLSQDSFWSIISEILFSRRESEGFPAISQAIVQAAGFMLEYGSKTWETETNHLHYIADTLGGITKINPWNATAEMEESSLFNSPEFKGCISFRERLIGILNANRLLDMKNCNAEAITIFNVLPHNHPEDLAYLALADRLRMRLGALNGHDMMQIVNFAHNPPEWFSTNRLQTPERINKATVKQKANIAKKSKPPSKTARARNQTRPDPELEEQQKRWRVRLYPSPSSYKQSNAEWHKKSGFHVRQMNNNSIMVIADLTQVDAMSLSKIFGPLVTTIVTKSGNFRGKKWQPSE